jgi:quercetin dioxygenase-like cupin family protein
MASEAPKGVLLHLTDHVTYADDGVVSRTLLDKKTGTVTLFSFDAGQGLSEHTAPFDAAVQVLEGDAVIVIGGQALDARAGDFVVMPADVPHSLRAAKPFKMLLTMIRV